MSMRLFFHGREFCRLLPVICGDGGDGADDGSGVAGVEAGATEAADFEQPEAIVRGAADVRGPDAVGFRRVGCGVGESLGTGWRY
jgi:hypothetical protein